MDLFSAKYEGTKHKSLVFFSAGSPRDCELIMGVGINELLVSYFYLKKRLDAFDEILDEVNRRGGYFMTDSGGFSFIRAGRKDGIEDELLEESYWLPYLEEYVDWLRRNAKKIFVAANLDLDVYVGKEVVDKWNKKYFEPLEKHMNIVYVAQPTYGATDDAKGAMPRFKEYCKKYKYVGIPTIFLPRISTVYQEAKRNGNIIHGFGWTSIPGLKKFPLFSVDSTTWLGGAKFGTSYMYDGKNFRVMDFKHKYLRKTDKLFCHENGIDYELLIEENNNEVNKYNLVNWKGAVQEYLKIADLKLTNKTVNNYIHK